MGFYTPHGVTSFRTHLWTDTARSRRFYTPYGVTSFRTRWDGDVSIERRGVSFYTPYGVTSFRTIAPYDYRCICREGVSIRLMA